MIWIVIKPTEVALLFKNEIPNIKIQIIPNNTLKKFEDQLKSDKNNDTSTFQELYLTISETKELINSIQEQTNNTFPKKKIIDDNHICIVPKKGLLKKIILKEKQETEIQIRIANRDIKKLESENKKIESEEPILKYSFKINGGYIADALEKYRNEIENEVVKFNKSQLKINDLDQFIKKCQHVTDKSSFIFQNNTFRKALGLKKEIKIRTDFDSTRFKLPLFQIFNTGNNITLLGEAGAGKTTCLQMYSLMKKEETDKLVFIAPLSQIMQNWSITKSLIDENKKIKNFELALHEYLCFCGLSISANNFKSNLKYNKTLLLLDGVDEVIKYAPWLPKAIVFISKKYEKQMQIIITSRSTGEYIDDLPFFSITLLPFTIEQRNQFIDKWFEKKGAAYSENVKKHLRENKSICEITRNPLLTTTLCVLAAHELPLPQTEIKLYYDRIRLLTGYFDNVKNVVTRITNTPQNLEKLAQKIAFSYHKAGVRQKEINEIYKIAESESKNFLNIDQSKKAVNELIDPCNILVPMTNKREFGFGHLSYQEHLTALEICSNRSIDIVPLLANSWWLGVLIFFAQISENITWLIDELDDLNMESKTLRRNLEQLKKYRPKNERKIIENKIYQLK